jgi:hypothetical protein
MIPEMIWSDLRGDTESQAETPWPSARERRSNNVNGPKVDNAALVKSGYLRESPRILHYSPISNRQ